VDHSDDAYELLSKQRIGIVVDETAQLSLPNSVTVLHADHGNGTACRLAHKLASRARKSGLETVVNSVEKYDLDDLPGESLVIFVVSTQEGGEHTQY